MRVRASSAFMAVPGGKGCIALIALTSVLVLTACGSSSPKPAGPPSASTLASKIPGCGDLLTNTPSVIAVEDVTCTLQDGAPIEIATFANSADERQWIADGGYPPDPDPAYAGCCIEGNGWAATVGFNSSLGPMDVDYNYVIKAIGGRQVQG
jgi:hypothetical protein